MGGARFGAALLLLSATVGVQADAADRTPAGARHIQEPDHRRLDAERSSAEALALRQQGTAESLKASVPAFERAIAEWRAVPDRTQLASALRGLGRASPRAVDAAKDAALVQSVFLGRVHASGRLALTRRP